MQKTTSFKVKGMLMDLSASAFNPEYAYENKNIRIMPTDDNTLLSIINEKGTDLVNNIEGVGSMLNGAPIGLATIDNELIVFTTLPNSNYAKKDRIYRIWLDNNTIRGEELFNGDLNFDYINPIETLSFYENESIKKVYWVDGKNLPRVINIAATSEIVKKWTNNSFDFVQSLRLQEEIDISRDVVSSGSFSPGVIQYAFTYFNKYGLESNIFYTSPLYYISYNNRGASPTDKVSNSFNITIKKDGIDLSFDYIRIYSIHRTSINNIPIVKRVADISIPIGNIEEDLVYTDIGLSQDSIDPVLLLYIGGEEIIAGTIALKDNTLFLGNIEVKRNNLLNSTVRNYFNNKQVTFTAYYKKLSSPSPIGNYPYENQLNMNSYQIKYFKYLEWYRFGILALHYTGKWSDPIWINDQQNTVPVNTIFYLGTDTGLPVATFTLNDSTIIQELFSLGYIRVRPVVVYPTINEREVICQGILCPTVYNVSDRYSNSPFALSSWFVRPNAPFDITRSGCYKKTEEGTCIADYRPLGSVGYSLYSRAGILANNYAKTTDILIDPINKGVWNEFRHNRPVPSNVNRNAEILCIYGPPRDPYVDDSLSESEITSWVSQYAENYYIDQSILTLHSPDIEFDTSLRSIDTSGLKLRIVGVVPLTSFSSDIDIETSTPVNNFYKNSETPIGFYKEPIGVENLFGGDSHFGWRGLSTGVFWLDEITGRTTENDSQYSTGFVVYPWHRNGSLNNTKFSTDGYRSAMLKMKRMSNTRYSYKTQYLDIDHIWNAYSSGSTTQTGISGVAIFDSDQVSLVRIPAPANSGLPDINYYGNIDKLLTMSRIGDSKKDGYPIICSGEDDASSHSHSLFIAPYRALSVRSGTKHLTGTDPVRIKYKSTPHAVMALNYSIQNGVRMLRILPNISDFDLEYTDSKYTITYWTVNNQKEDFPSGYKLFWDKKSYAGGVFLDSILVNQNDIGMGDAVIGGIQYGWLWLGELYNDNIINRFGGLTLEAFENNQWIPCGSSVSIIDEWGTDSSSTTLKDKIEIIWEEGDTYYQRYDHIKTYPFTTEDLNQVTDIVSFMCETRVNIDGSYDRNRGQVSNLSITPENFNKLNDVYSQLNNFFNYRASNPDKLNIRKYPNWICYTLSKSSGELIDTWTNVTLASTLDLDGDKGPIRSLRRFNNNIFSFLDKGISLLLYNENMLISSTEGVPIEIANSGKVNGKRYLTTNIGCTNKWSMCETPNGIYFIDDITKGIFLFNGQLVNLSDRLGLHSWINKVSTGTNIWNPVDFDNFVTYYDKVNGDVFFINKDYCLGYSEPLNLFTSFYSYNNTPYFSTIKDNSIWIKDSRLWLHNKGDYNQFFGNYHPFYTTVIANPDMLVDKIFNNLEFRADSWDRNGNLLNTTFDRLTTWNEYQNGSLNLIHTSNKPSPLKRKFRIWRSNIPRDSSNGRDRMRNPWLYIKLSMENPNTNKTILHDIMVHYFE